MYAIINDEPLPEKTLRTVILVLGAGVSIVGDALKEQDRIDVITILGGIKEGDVVQFDVEDYAGNKFNGPGKIKLLKTEEGGLDEKLMRLKYTIAIEYIK